MKHIPISAAKHIADAYGYHQVVVIARCVGESGGEHCTTYGVDKVHCKVAASIGDFLKHKVMGWPREASPAAEDILRDITLQLRAWRPAASVALEDALKRADELLGQETPRGGLRRLAARQQRTRTNG